MANQNKIQICLDEDVYAIIKNLKPRSLKLFVSVAIESFAKTEESKLFFKKLDSVEKEITKNTPKKVELKKSESLQEWE